MKLQTPNGNKLCPTLQKSFDAALKASDVAELFHAIGSAAELKCSTFKVTEDLKNVLQAALNSKNVESMYFASQSIRALSSLKNVPSALENLSFKGIDATVMELLEEDGSVRSNPENAEGSAYHAGLALATIGTISSKSPSAVSKSIARQLGDKVQALMKLGIKDEKVDFTQGAPAGISPLEAVAAVVEGVQSIGRVVSEPVDIKKSQMIALGDYILRHAYVGNVEDADALTSIANYLSDNNVFIPYYVSVSSGASKASFRFRVTDILGAPTTKLNLIVASAKMKGSKDEIKDVVIQPVSADSDNADYVLNEKSVAQFQRLQPGLYDFKLKIVPSSKSEKKYQSQGDVTVVGKLAWDATKKSERVEIAFSENSAKYSAKDDKDVVRTLRFPEEIQGTPLTLDASKHLHVKLTFDKDGYKPKSAFVHFRHATLSGVEANFVLKASKEDANTYGLKLSLGSSELIESLAGSGSYIISLRYGDVAMDRLVEWKVATIELTIPSPAARLDPIAAFTTRTPIHHTFRQPDARPFALMPMIFTLAVAAPFVGLIFYLLTYSGVTFAFPTNPTEFLYALVFQGSILAILLSYTLYWLSLNIFQALALMSVCGIVAIFSGTGALRLLHQRSKEANKTKEE